MMRLAELASICLRLLHLIKLPATVEERSEGVHLVTISNVVKLQRTNTRTRSSMSLEAHMVANGLTTLKAVGGGNGYAAEVTFGNTQLLLSIDTGSSDTWVASQHVQCIGPFGWQLPQTSCMFGPLFNETFDEGQILDQNFNISYGSGEFVIGTMGYSNISIGGISVDKQEVAIVDKAFWLGDQETSGLAGLAYAALTSSYNGSNPRLDNQQSNLVQYKPLVETAQADGIFSMFSLAIERGTGGYLAFNGLPPVDHSQTFATTPIESTVLLQRAYQTPVHSFYTIRPDGFLVGNALKEVNSSAGVGVPVIIDSGESSRWLGIPELMQSGTTLNYLPASIVEDLHSLYNPPARYNRYAGAWEVDCDAEPASFGVRINGVDLYMDEQDMILQGDTGYDSASGLCVTTVQATPGTPYILGDAFLKNVVAVFDIGASEMRFATRQSV